MKKVSINSYFTVTCPFISKRRLEKNGYIRFGAARMSAAVDVGANIGIAMNENLGLCIIGGVDAIGLGASVTLGSFEIGVGSLESTGSGSIFY